MSSSKNILNYYHGKWYIDEKLLLKKASRLRNDKEWDESLLYEDILNNTDFLDYIIDSYIEELDFNFVLEYVFNKRERNLPISISNIIVEAKDRWPLLTDIQKSKMEKIFGLVDYSDELKKKKDILLSDESLAEYIKFLQLDIAQLTKEIDEDSSNMKNILDITFLCSVNYKSFCEYLDKAGLTEIDQETIKNNYKSLIEYAKSKKRMESNMCYAKNLTDEFELNPKIKDEILNTMPGDFTDIQKAYFIYKRLCQLLSYDDEYYYNLSLIKYKKFDIQKKLKRDYKDISLLSEIKQGDEITCTKVTLIFCKFLEELNIPYNIVDYDNFPVKEYGSKHMKAKFKIGTTFFDADAADGLFDSDLSLQKLFGEVKRFSICSSPEEEKVKEEMKKVDDYFNEHQEIFEFKNACYLFRKFCMSKEGTNLSFDKFASVMEMISNDSFCRDKGFTVEERSEMHDFIIYLLQLKGVSDGSNYNLLDLFSIVSALSNNRYIVNHKPKDESQNYELALLVNNSDTYDDTIANNDSDDDKYYTVIYSNGTYEKMSYSEVQKKFKTGIFSTTRDTSKLRFSDVDLGEIVGGEIKK